MATYNVTTPGVVAATKGNVHTLRFDSLTAALAFVAAPLASMGCDHNETPSRYFSESGEWNFGSFGNATAYRKGIVEGWPAAVARIESLIATVSSTMAAPLDLRRKPRRGAQGDEFCVHTARAGKLDRAWSRRDRVYSKARAPIRILVDCTANSNVAEEAFFWRGAAAVALAKPLAARGYRVAVTALVGTRGTYDGGKGFLSAIEVKGYGESLDVPRLAALLCSPATLRYLGFRCMARTPGTLQGGLGHALYGDQCMQACAEAGMFGYRTEERFSIPDLWTEDKAKTWLGKVSAQFAA
jgi:hypothetical protein